LTISGTWLDETGVGKINIHQLSREHDNLELANYVFFYI